jgi:hypothetical protein
MHFTPYSGKSLKVVAPASTKTNVRVANEQAFFDLGDTVELADRASPYKRIAIGIRKA